MNPYHFGQHPQPVGGQNHGQHDQNQNPNPPTVMPYTDRQFQGNFAGPNPPGHPYNNPVMLNPALGAPAMPFDLAPLAVPPTGSPRLVYNPHAGHPVAPLRGQPMIGHWAIDYPGSYATPGPSPFHYTPSTSSNPPQIPTPIPPIPQQWSVTATNTPSVNTQRPVGFPSPQSSPPVAFSEVPLFQRPPPSLNANNIVGPTYPVNTSPVPGPSRPQGPPPDSRLNHIRDPAVHAMYQDLHLQAELKDPKKQQPGATVNIRREKKVVLTLALHSDSYPISNRGWEGILLPQTRSVESGPVQQISPTKLLKLSIQVLACARGDVNAQPCNNCWSRERPPNDHTIQPYMIDFKALSHQIILDRTNTYLTADVKFHFTCYSRHHEGLYGLILKLHDESDKLVAHCLLPYKFVVRANGNDTGVGYSETQEHTPAQQQTLGPVFPVPNQPPAPTRSPVPPMNFHFAPASQHLQPNPNPSATILQRLAPAEGPVSGGPTIWLSGINFPPPYQQMVYARFGAVVVPTIWLNTHTLECRLPPAPAPGTVDVTLSLYHQPGGPEFGQSHCSFRYNLEFDYLHALLRTISGQSHSLTPANWDAMIPHFVHNVSPAGRQKLHQATQPDQPMNLPFSTTAGEMEALTVQLLASFTNSASCEDSISFVNEHHQTLAHLAVLFRYPTLLEKVAQWGINVDVQDVNGFTALHCAYLCGDLNAVRILKSYGADEDVKDSLGRRPEDMYIPRENGSPTSDRSSDEWEKVSPPSSQQGSSNGCEQQLDAGASTTSSRIVPASISMPSPTYDTSSSTDQALMNRFSEFSLFDSPTELESSRSSPHFPDVPVVQLHRPSSESRTPAPAHQGMPTRPQGCGHSYSNAPSPNPTPRLSISEARAQPSRSPEPTNSQGVVRSDNTPSTSPPLPTASIQMPVPCPFQRDIPGFRPPSLLDPQTAHSNPSTASCHSTTPCPGTKAESKSQPVTRPPSADPSTTTKRFSPPSRPRSGVPGPGLKSVSPSIYSDANLPPYEGPEKFIEDKKLLLSAMIDGIEGSKGGSARLSPGREKQEHIVQERDILGAKEGTGKEKRINLNEGGPFSSLRRGDT